MVRFHEGGYTRPLSVMLLEAFLEACWSVDADEKAERRLTFDNILSSGKNPEKNPILFSPVYSYGMQGC